jgi:nitrous oxide reductase accessory protein NosL
MAAWVVTFETDGSEAPVIVGPFLELENAERFAEKFGGSVSLLDAPEVYA